MNRERSFVYIGASILVSVVVLLFLARPAYQDMITSKKNLSAVRETERQRLQEIADVKKLMADYSSTPQDKIDDLNAHIPLGVDEAGIIAQLEAIGKDTRALITSIKFQEDEELTVGASIRPIDVTVLISGDYPQIEDFVSSLEQNKRLYNLQDVSFNSTGNGLTASIDFTTYYSSAEKAAETPEIEETSTNTNG